MTSFLIIAKNKQNRQEYIFAFCKEKNIDGFDITTIEKDEAKQSIGIDDVKQMQKKLFLKPIRSQTKAVILQDGHLLTIEAQNALLKVLEEPPEHTIIIIAADSEETLLPTIRSRCQLIKLKEEAQTFSEKERQELTVFIEEVNQMTIPQALKKVELLAKDKQKAMEWIEKVILISRDEMLKQSSRTQNSVSLHYQIKSLQQLHTRLKTTNVNLRFALESTLLGLIN